ISHVIFKLARLDNKSALNISVFSSTNTQLDQSHVMSHKTNFQDRDNSAGGLAVPHDQKLRVHAPVTKTALEIYLLSVKYELRVVDKPGAWTEQLLLLASHTKTNQILIRCLQILAKPTHTPSPPLFAFHP
ncbi:hypothetical protein Ciccas_010670, partial [Cichlidogyrus casuarinus]